MSAQHTPEPKFVVYGKAEGLMYSVRGVDGTAVCTCAYNPSSHMDREAWAQHIAAALNAYLPARAAIAKAGGAS